MAITRRLGRDLEDEHAARRPRQHPAVARPEEGRHARRVHARQRPAAEAADGQPLDAIAARRGARSKTPTCRIPATGAEVIVLANGNWALIYNDLERGRYSLAVSLSEDEGRTWPWTRHLERDPDVDRTSSSSASITTRRSSRPPTARCTRPTASSPPPASATPDAREAPAAQGDQARALQRGVGEIAVEASRQRSSGDTSHR